jgi:hypothetical protein
VKVFDGDPRWCLDPLSPDWLGRVDVLNLAVCRPASSVQYLLALSTEWPNIGADTVANAGAGFRPPSKPAAVPFSVAS